MLFKRMTYMTRVHVTVASCANKIKVEEREDRDTIGIDCLVSKGSNRPYRQVGFDWLHSSYKLIVSNPQ